MVTIGIIIVILLLVIYINHKRKPSITANKSTITREQLLTILANGFFYTKYVSTNQYPTIDNLEALKNTDSLEKLENAKRSVLALYEKIDTAPVKNKLVTVDDNTSFMSRDANKSLLSYSKNLALFNPYRFNGINYDFAILSDSYQRVFGALHDNKITMDELCLGSVSIDDLNISGLPY